LGESPAVTAYSLTI